MKKLAIIALAAMSTYAFAGGAGDRHRPQPCGVCEGNGVAVGAPQIQITALKHSSSTAEATGADSYASNNVSSNTFGVRLRALSTQITALKDSTISAHASGANSTAQNNLASNIGEVAVNAAQLQVVAGKGSHMTAKASGANSRAVQNFSTNNACESCQ